MSSSLCCLILAVVLLISAFSVRGEVAADEITTLPGWTGKLPSRHYSGFFPTTLDGSKGGMLHYWLTLSENKPATDPLVIWLQGGPGCSSLFGMLYENGQFRFSGELDENDQPTLVQNPYAWTKVANMLWLEQPVGVGFSYCLNNNCTCDYEGCPFGVDSYGFLVNFFKAWPELTKLDMHISGESYGGVYVPFVADAVLTGNKQGGNTPINLKGILIGNGVGGLLNQTEQLQRRSDFFYGHAMYSYQQQKQIDAVCDWSSSPVSSQCEEAVNAALDGVGSYYIYNIYDDCPHDLEKVAVADLTDDQLAQAGLFAPVMDKKLKDLSFVCVLESVSSDYLNSPAVQKAIHVTQANVTNWGPCGSTNAYNHDLINRHRIEMMGLTDARLHELYAKLIKELPILIYSGDVDQCVPYYYSDNWVRNLGYPVTSEWKPWTYGTNGHYVGGYVTIYKAPNTLTFLTVKDSGHMVPQYAPEAALTLFTRYLTGTPY